MGHNVHGPALLPVAPALQAQAVETALAAGESECIGHAWQVADDVAPMLAEYVPFPQLEQSAAAAAENLPASQSSHVVAPSVFEYWPLPQPQHPPDPVNFL